MHQIISRKALCGYLSLLRGKMKEQPLFPAPNVIFLNSRALYHHLSKQHCGDDTIGGILKKIETCIPLAVTEESFSLFLSACREPRCERTLHFLESSKADFLLLIQQTAHDDVQWASLTALCERLRLKNAGKEDFFHGT